MPRRTRILTCLYCRWSRYATRMPKPADLLQGTLDLLILKTLAREPLHGWGVAKRIQQGWITATWHETDLGRRAKFYAISREGRAQLTRELQTWKRLSSAVGLLLKRA